MSPARWGSGILTGVSLHGRGAFRASILSPTHRDCCVWDQMRSREGKQLKVLVAHVQLSGIPWTVACQAPLFMEFSRQEYWSGHTFPLLEIFPTQGLNPGLPCGRQILYRLSDQGRPKRVKTSAMG